MAQNKGGKVYEAYIEKVIDDLKEQNGEEEAKELGFDLNLLKRRELNINLIHFDKNMTNPENYGYYNNFKVDVVGGFLAMDELNMFKKYLEVIKNKDIPFIVISSGSSGNDVIPICKKYEFVKEVIIFCENYEFNKHYKNEYPGYVKKVFTEIDRVYEYLASFGANKEGIEKYRNSDQFIFSYDEIKMNKQLEQCPVISAYEYDKCYFLIHRTYAHFFEDINDRNKDVTLTRGNFKKIKDYINSSKILNNTNKNELLKKFEPLVNSKNFTELSIRTYTDESCFCYIFNRTMRNFEPGLISLAYYMGPLLYGLNKYVKENPQNFSFSKNMKLNRIIQCSIYDFYLYKMNLNHIICFPSITSTTIDDDYKPTNLAGTINKYEFKSDDMIILKMIFNYKHQPGNISPGIIIKNYLASDGEPLSTNPVENEVILFPFTFVKITEIEKIEERIYVMKLDIINRKEYIEDALRDDVENRTSFSKLDKKLNNLE